MNKIFYQRIFVAFFFLLILMMFRPQQLLCLTTENKANASGKVVVCYIYLEPKGDISEKTYILKQGNVQLDSGTLDSDIRSTISLPAGTAKINIVIVPFSPICHEINLNSQISPTVSYEAIKKFYEQLSSTFPLDNDSNRIGIMKANTDIRKPLETALGKKTDDDTVEKISTNLANLNKWLKKASEINCNNLGSNISQIQEWDIDGMRKEIDRLYEEINKNEKEILKNKDLNWELIVANKLIFFNIFKNQQDSIYAAINELKAFKANIVDTDLDGKQFKSITLDRFEKVSCDLEVKDTEKYNSQKSHYKLLFEFEPSSKVKFSYYVGAIYAFIKNSDNELLGANLLSINYEIDPLFIPGIQIGIPIGKVGIFGGLCFQFADLFQLGAGMVKLENTKVAPYIQASVNLAELFGKK